MIEFVKLGLLFGLAYCIVATAIVVLLKGQADADGFNVLLLYVVYLAAGAISGGAAYLAKIWVKNKVTAAIAGFVIAIPVFSLFAIAAFPAERWFEIETLVGVLFAAVLLGPVVGVDFWRDPM